MKENASVWWFVGFCFFGGVFGVFFMCMNSEDKDAASKGAKEDAKTAIQMPQEDSDVKDADNNNFLSHDSAALAGEWFMGGFRCLVDRLVVVMYFWVFAGSGFFLGRLTQIGTRGQRRGAAGRHTNSEPFSTVVSSIQQRQPRRGPCIKAFRETCPRSRRSLMDSLCFLVFGFGCVLLGMCWCVFVVCPVEQK